MAQATPVPLPYGAALQSVVDRFGGRVRETESNPSIGVAASSAVGNNPDRVALVFINLSANSIGLGLRPTVTLTNCILLGANGGAVMLDVLEDFTLPAREWFAIAGGAASSLYVLEVVRDVLA